MPRWTISTLGLLCALPLSAAWADPTALWLGLPGDAANAAMAGARGALAEDTSALGTNPAGLAFLRNGEVGLLHNQWARDLALEHAAAGFKMDKAGLALGGDFLNFGAVDLYNVTAGVPVAAGTYSPTALDLALEGGLEAAPGIALGAGVKLVQQSLETGVSSSTVAGDLGARFKDPLLGLSIGLALLNLGGTLDGGDLPMSLELSGGYRLLLDYGHELSLGVQGGWSMKDGNGSGGGFGAEYSYQGTLALRAGYRLASRGGLSYLAGLTAGVGLDLGAVEISYAMNNLADLGMGHLFSLGYRFGQEAGPAPPAPTDLEMGWEEEKAVLRWREVRLPGVVGYNFYLKKHKDKAPKKMNDGPIQDDYVTLSHLKKGVTYHFGVTTLDRNGRESAMTVIEYTGE